jgi:hypothetical protein
LIQVSGGGLSITVSGLDEVIAALSAVRAAARNFNAPLRKAGEEVETLAQRIVPVRTGNLRSTIHVGTPRKNKVLVVAGGPDAVYAPIIEYGDPNRGLAGQPYMSTALERSETVIVDTLAEGLADIWSKQGFKVS